MSGCPIHARTLRMGGVKQPRAKLKPSPTPAQSVPTLPPQPRFDNMKKSREPDPLAERRTLDFSKGVRGKHHKRMQEGTNVVLIAPAHLQGSPQTGRARLQPCQKQSAPKEPTALPQAGVKPQAKRLNCLPQQRHKPSGQ